MAFSVTKEEEMVILMEAVCVLNMILLMDLSMTEEEEMVMSTCSPILEAEVPCKSILEVEMHYESILEAEVPYDSMMEAVVE